MFYATCIGPELKLDLKAKVTLKLYTRFKVLTKTVKFLDILLFKNKVLKGLNTIKFNPGEHCAQCYKFSVCAPAQKKAEQSTIKFLNSPQNYEHLKNLKILKKYLDELEKQAIIDYKDGKEFKNFEFYETPGKRYWKSAAVPELMKRSDLVEVKLISVREALKKDDTLKEGEHYNKVPSIKIKTKEEVNT